MSIAVTSIRKVGVISWEYSWSATTAPYRVYHRGRLIESVTDTEYVIEYPGATAEPPILEILDANDTGQAGQMQYSPRMTLQWRAVDGAERYRIKRYVDAAWETIAHVYESGAGYYTYQSDVLDDLADELWRVVALDEYDNETDDIEFVVTIVRNPDAPEIAMSYDKPNSEIDIEAA